MREAAIYSENGDLDGTFYVGSEGRLPRLGELVVVLNQFDGTVYECEVTELLRKTMEYKVRRCTYKSQILKLSFQAQQSIDN